MDTFSKRAFIFFVVNAHIIAPVLSQSNSDILSKMKLQRPTTTRVYLDVLGGAGIHRGSRQTNVDEWEDKENDIFQPDFSEYLQKNNYVSEKTANKDSLNKRALDDLGGAWLHPFKKRVLDPLGGFGLHPYKRGNKRGFDTLGGYWLHPYKRALDPIGGYFLPQDKRAFDTLGGAYLPAYKRGLDPLGGAFLPAYKRGLDPLGGAFLPPYKRALDQLGGFYLPAYKRAFDSLGGFYLPQYRKRELDQLDDSDLSQYRKQIVGEESQSMADTVDGTSGGNSNSLDDILDDFPHQFKRSTDHARPVA